MHDSTVTFTSTRVSIWPLNRAHAPLHLSFPDGVQDAAQCTLYRGVGASVDACGGAPPASRRCVAVLHGWSFLYVYSSEGSIDDVALPFSACRLLPLRAGLLLQRRTRGLGALPPPLPTWFSVFHPLEAPVPVALGSPARGFPLAPASCGPFACDGEELLCAVDGGAHRALLAHDAARARVVAYAVFGSRAHVSMELPPLGANGGGGGPGAGARGSSAPSAAGVAAGAAAAALSPAPAALSPARRPWARPTTSRPARPRAARALRRPGCFASAVALRPPPPQCAQAMGWWWRCRWRRRRQRRRRSCPSGRRFGKRWGSFQ